MNIDILLGKTQEHLVPLEGTKFFIHKDTLKDFLRLQNEAKLAGFDLQIASAFRDYDRQLKIWNLKASGQRKLFDDQGNELDFQKLSPKEVMFAIMRWSAIPGCSRHHWGTDIDVYDANTQAEQDVKLTPSECEGNGPAAPLHQWLDSMIDQQSSFGFFRPYKTDRGGIAPERWHLSHGPQASKLFNFFTSSIFKRNLENPELLLREQLLDHADEIFQRYILNIDQP